MPKEQVQIHSVTSRCKVTVWHYNSQIVDASTQLTEDYTAITLENGYKQNEDSLLGFQYKKPISDGPGEFQLTLAPNKNWVKYISAGDWIAIYLTQGDDGGWSLRCLGNVNRISRVEKLDNKGKKNVTYVVTGFDFGKVFFSTDIFFNYFLYENMWMLNGLTEVFKRSGEPALMGSPQKWITGFLQLFLGPSQGAIPITRLTQQWHIPPALLQLFGNKTGGNGSNLFYNILRTRFIKDPGGWKMDAQLPTNVLLWQLLKTYSHYQVNQLYFELENDPDTNMVVPTLTNMMYPFAFKDYEDPSGGISSIYRFLDLECVEIDYSHITSMNVGVADHDRKNYFFTAPVQKRGSETSEPAYVLQTDGTLPNTTCTNSIKRYGTHLDVDTDEFLLFDKNAGMNLRLMSGVNYLRHHWFKNNQCFLNGIMTILGNPDVRVGKRLVINPSNSYYDLPQHFYITQYVDNWKFPGTWTQVVAVNRGIYVKNGKEKFAIEVETEDFVGTGVSDIGGMTR